MDLAAQFASKSIYKFQRKVGSGGSAEVFLYSRQTEGFPDQDVVLKVLKSADEETIRELLNDGNRLGALRHPNILTTFGYEKIDDKKFGLVLEYFPGENLRALIDRFSNEKRFLIAAHIIRVLCEVLSLAHLQDIVHGDFGGRNILVSEQGQIKLSDFGLACRQSKATNRRLPLKGSADYLAPERWEGQGPSTASDIFGLGILAYEILSGTHPLAGSSGNFGPARVRDFLKRKEWRQFKLWNDFFDGTLCEEGLRLSAQELLKKIPSENTSPIDIQKIISEYVRPRAELNRQIDRLKTQTHIFSVSLLSRGRRIIRSARLVVVFVLSLMTLMMTSLATGRDLGPSQFRPCVLTLTSRPWGELFIDGVSQGFTPFINLRVPPGFHTLIWRDQKGRQLIKSLMAYQNSTLAFKISDESGHPKAQPLPPFREYKNF